MPNKNFINSAAFRWIWDNDENVVGYRKTPYFRLQGSHWYCTLCQTGGMHRSVVHAHASSHDHKRKYQQMQATRDHLDRCAWWQGHVAPRVARLPHHPWKNRMCRFYYDFVNAKETTLGPNQERDRILKAVSNFEKKEKLSLLELVVWKTNCLVHHAELVGSDPASVTMQEIEDYWALDERFNPITYRRELRIKSGIHELIQNVLPFLGNSF